MDFWKSKNTWNKASVNTFWCLLGCSIGDFGALFYFSQYAKETNPILIMVVAITCGLITSIILESFILFRQLKNIKEAIKLALSMSLISMIAMEFAMNIVDFTLVGPGNLTLWVIPFAILAGFLTPLPYNYYRLKKWGKKCH
jgi:hypothetical protein